MNKYRESEINNYSLRCNIEGNVALKKIMKRQYSISEINKFRAIELSAE